MCDGWEEKIGDRIPCDEDENIVEAELNDHDTFHEPIVAKSTLIANGEESPLEKKIAGAPLSLHQLRQGFIMKEILGPPRCKQRKARFTSREKS